MRRFDNPKDFVRIELEAAVARDIRVIPVLVDGAKMPGEGELPEVLRSLSSRNAVVLNVAIACALTTLLALITTGLILAQRRNVFGGGELAVYWLSCVLPIILTIFWSFNLTRYGEFESGSLYASAIITTLSGPPLQLWWMRRMQRQYSGQQRGNQG